MVTCFWPTTRAQSRSAQASCALPWAQGSLLGSFHALDMPRACSQVVRQREPDTPAISHGWSGHGPAPSVEIGHGECHQPRGSSQRESGKDQSRHDQPWGVDQPRLSTPPCLTAVTTPRISHDPSVETWSAAINRDLTPGPLSSNHDQPPCPQDLPRPRPSVQISHGLSRPDTRSGSATTPGCQCPIMSPTSGRTECGPPPPGRCTCLTRGPPSLEF